MVCFLVFTFKILIGKKSNAQRKKGREVERKRERDAEYPSTPTHPPAECMPHRSGYEITVFGRGQQGVCVGVVYCFSRFSFRFRHVFLSATIYPLSETNCQSARVWKRRQGG